MTFASSIIYSLERSFAVACPPPISQLSASVSFHPHIIPPRALIMLRKMKIMKESQYVIEISHVKKRRDEERSNYTYDVYNDDVDDMTRK